MSRRSWCSLAAALLLAADVAHAQQPIDETQAVALAVAHNPDLRAALYEVWQASQAVASERDRYAPVLSLDAGVTHASSPRLSSGASTTSSSTDTVALGQQLTKAFPWGTSFSARLEQGRFSSTSPLFTGSDQEVTLGPGFSMLGRLAVAQPLLRGAGSDVGEAELRAARFDRTAAMRARDNTASDLIRGVLGAYWELWYAGRTLAIEEAARKLARQQLAEAKARLQAGADAPVDLLPFEGRIAELDESVLAAEQARKSRALDLGQLLGKTGAASTRWIAAATGVPELAAPPPAEQVVARALAESHELKQLDARLALARDRVKTAGEANRARLDLEGYVQTEGLGNERVGPALEGFVTFGAISAHVGLIYEVPLFSGRRQADIARARYAVDQARERIKSARQRIETSVRQSLLQEVTARRRLSLALRTMSIRERQLEAAEARFKLGDAIGIEVREAEEALRRARLRLTRARVDVVLASLTRAHLTGELLLRYRQLVKPLERGPGALLGAVRPVF